MSLSLKVDASLHSFLKNSEEALNQHAKAFNSFNAVVSSELKKKIEPEMIAEGLFRLVPALDLPSEEIKKAVRPMIPSLLAESVKNPLDSAINCIANKAVINSKAFLLLFQRNEKLLGKTKKLKKKQKEAEKEVKEVDKKTEKIEEKIEELNRKIEENEKTRVQKQLALEKKFNDLESATLWRVKDCEELLKSRINEQFVRDAIKNSLDKIFKDIEEKVKQISRSSQSQFEEGLKKKMKKNKEHLSLKIEENSLKMKAVEKAVENKAEKTEVIESYREIMKKLEPLFETGKRLESLNQKIEENEKRIEKNESIFPKIEVDFQEVKEKLEILETKQNEEKTAEVSPVQMAELEELIAKSRKYFFHSEFEPEESLSLECSHLEAQIKEKVNVTDFLVQVDNKLSKEDLLHFVTSEEDRMRRTRKEIEDLEKKMERMEGEIETNAKKKIKKNLEQVLDQLNIGSIERSLKGKADEGETRRELDAIEERVQGILESSLKNQEIIGRLNEQFSRIEESFLNVKSQVQKKLQTTQSQAPTIHNFCITCGHREARFLTNSQMIRGSDGKLYYGDPENPTTPSYNLGMTVYDRIDLANKSQKMSQEDRNLFSQNQSMARPKSNGMRSNQLSFVYRLIL